MQIYDMFKVSISEEQTKHINAFLLMGIFVVCGISVLAIFQKLLEIKVWSLAQENEIKSESLTKEMIGAMEAKDRFISMISHEIRNPLNTLKGSVDYLMQVEGNPSHIKVLRNAQLSGEILLNLVNNILDAAKLKSDKIEIHYAETNFIDIVKKALTVNSELLREKKLIAKAQIDERIPGNIKIDGSRLLQVLLNLMSNAVKFTPKGGRIEIYAEWSSRKDDNLLKPIVKLERRASIVRRQIEESLCDISDLQEMSSESMILFNDRLQEVATKRSWQGNGSYSQTEKDIWELKIIKRPQSNENIRGEESARSMGYLKIQVTDTGAGVAENEIPKLFGMFEQASEHSRSAHGGSGLGLWICKQICQKMNGDITLYSELGKGTSFVLYIPVRNNRDQMSRVPTGTTLTGKLRALVVDDFSTNRYIHQLLLEQQGVQVVTASDGNEAVEKYQQGRNEIFTFILMDVNMPVMDGLTAAIKIREWEMENNKDQTDIYFVTGEYFNEADVFMRFKNVVGSNSGIKYLKKPLGSDAEKDCCFI